MNLESLITHAVKRQASDLHLEPGLPAALRIKGSLVSSGETLSAGLVRGLVREAVGEPSWAEFRERGSCDRVITRAGVRCRINALHSMRGVGLAVRLLPDVCPTIESLNLHPELAKLAGPGHGLVLISGPTGCGKSSTLAALLQEINAHQACHVLTIEQPVEYCLVPEKAFIRQREVGRDTPSFDQALLDTLREDPDVIMVGELRDPETMRLTLNAAETGHLVMATVHSSNVAEALQRLVLAFPSGVQAGIAAQLADCLQAVVSQRLRYREDLDLRLPECEILTGAVAARHAVRQQEFVKLPSIMETGAAEGMWTRERYQTWLEHKTDFVRPLPPITTPAEPTRLQAPAVPTPTPTAPRAAPETDGVMVIEQPERDAKEILSELEGSKKLDG